MASAKQYPNQSPWAIPVAQVGSRESESLEIDRDFPAPSGIGDKFYGVKESSPIHVQARFDSITDGLLFTATASARMVGECGRCLTPIDRETTIQLTSFMPFETPEARKQKPGEEEEVIYTDDEDDTTDVTPLIGNGNFATIETLLRDGFAQAIPVTPLCKPDCLGLCPQCGMNLNEHPDHVHEQATDIRFSALADLKARLEAAEGNTEQTAAN